MINELEQAEFVDGMKVSVDLLPIRLSLEPEKGVSKTLVDNIISFPTSQFMKERHQTVGDILDRAFMIANKYSALDLSQGGKLKILNWAILILFKCFRRKIGVPSTQYSSPMRPSPKVRSPTTFLHLGAS